jgi:NAD(P)-dependent dehydrogenase (short-subunit alcohol dehydrogenase family)
MGSLNGKITIVTGARQGIGKAIAEQLPAEGATVVVTAWRSPPPDDGGRVARCGRDSR